MPPTTRPSFRLTAIGIALGLASAAPASAQSTTDADARIRALEERLETTTRQMNEALDALRRELRDAREAAASSTPSAAAPPAASLPAPETTTESAELRSQLFDTREQLNALQSRVDQQGVFQRFGDGIVFEDPRGNWSLRLAGRAQLDYRHYLQDDVLANSFSERRARIGVQLALYRDFAINVEGDFTFGETSTSTVSGTPPTAAAQTFQMTLGYLEYMHFREAKLRMGQFKPQFGLEQTLLDLQSDFMERGLTQNILDGNFINYDRGIMLHGQPIEPVYYALAYTNGNGQNREERQATLQDAKADGKDVTGRVVVDLAKAFDVRDAVYHFGGSFKTGTLTNSALSPFAPPGFRTEARGLTFFVPQPLNGAGFASGNVDRRIYAMETSLAYKGVKFTGEWWLADYRGTRTAPGAAVPFDHQIQASYVSVLWMLSGEYWSDFYRDGYWQKVRPNNRFSLDPGGGWGAWELGLRYSRMDASDFSAAANAATGQFTAAAPLATGTNKANSLTLQLKWTHNVFSKVMLDYVRTRFETPVITSSGVATDEESALMARYQIDF